MDRWAWESPGKLVEMAEAMGGKEKSEERDKESGYGMEIVFILPRAILVTFTSIFLGIIPSPITIGDMCPFDRVLPQLDTFDVQSCVFLFWC